MRKEYDNNYVNNELLLAEKKIEQLWAEGFYNFLQFYSFLLGFASQGEKQGKQERKEKKGKKNILHIF